MPAVRLSVIRFVRVLLSGHQAIAIENAAARSLPEKAETTGDALFPHFRR
jgi:hypothetical protein